MQSSWWGLAPLLLQDRNTYLIKTEICGNLRLIHVPNKRGVLKMVLGQMREKWKETNERTDISLGLYPRFPGYFWTDSICHQSRLWKSIKNVQMLTAKGDLQKEGKLARKLYCKPNVMILKWCNGKHSLESYIFLYWLGEPGQLRTYLTLYVSQFLQNKNYNTLQACMGSSVLVLVFSSIKW